MSVVRGMAIGTILSVLSIGSVQATLIDNGDWTTDDVTSLDWLDLTATVGQTYDEALTGNVGWRYATNAEVEGLFGTAFEGYYPNWSGGTDISAISQAAPYAGHENDVTKFQNLFGINPYFGNDFTLGFYIDESSTLRAMGTSEFFIAAGDSRIIGIDYVGEDYSNHVSSFGHDAFGTYLVRDTVSVVEPNSFALMFFGLAGLGFVRGKNEA